MQFELLIFVYSKYEDDDSDDEEVTKRFEVDQVTWYFCSSWDVQTFYSLSSFYFEESGIPQLHSRAEGTKGKVRLDPSDGVCINV